MIIVEELFHIWYILYPQRKYKYHSSKIFFEELIFRIINEGF